MQKTGTQTITIETTVHAPVAKVWEYWTAPQHIVQWNCASPDWHSPRVENNVTTGGRFNIRMEAKDGSMGFDFAGTYDKVVSTEQINYTLSDGRKVSVGFISDPKGTRIVEAFETETENSIDMQRNGWLAILNNFKKYAESQ